LIHPIALGSPRPDLSNHSEDAEGLRGVRTARCPWRETLIGALLGTGAPLGALLLRMLGGVRDVPGELAANAFFYIYALIATCLVFGLAGCLEGRRAARFRSSRDEYRDLAEHDDLTTLANARAFAAHQRRAAEHSARYREPLSLLLLDVDQLKAINDTLGHKAGGAALVRVAEVLNECKRGDDLAARWGGDEFALLMCGADVVAARRQAESIVERLRTRPLRVGARERPISVTIGIATSAGGNARDLFDRADRALYAGKAAGRNCVVSDAD
jgi:diguanylate cyclase (GGDEF)-like protein